MSFDSLQRIQPIHPPAGAIIKTKGRWRPENHDPGQVRCHLDGRILGANERAHELHQFLRETAIY